MYVTPRMCGAADNIFLRRTCRITKLRHSSQQPTYSSSNSPDLTFVLSPNDNRHVRVGFSDLSKVIHVALPNRQSKGRYQGCCHSTEQAIQHRSRADSAGWAILEEDEEEKQLVETPKGR